MVYLNKIKIISLNFAKPFVLGIILPFKQYVDYNLCLKTNKKIRGSHSTLSLWKVNSTWPMGRIDNRGN